MELSVTSPRGYYILGVDGSIRLVSSESFLAYECASGREPGASFDEDPIVRKMQEARLIAETAFDGPDRVVLTTYYRGIDDGQPSQFPQLWATSLRSGGADTILYRYTNPQEAAAGHDRALRYLSP